MKRNSIITLIAISSLLSANVALAQSTVFGGFTQSNGVTLPASRAPASSASPAVAAVAASPERVFGSFVREHGASIPATAGSAQSVVATRPAVRSNEVRFGSFVVIDGVARPSEPLRAPSTATEATAKVALRDH
ncbi:MAG: hypothetical protein RQ847_05055 [Wenzhouxiangellaceae bacterium]|nr:hypothetical protein [Wenzhouxiangellaceae bacterium]